MSCLTEVFFILFGSWGQESQGGVSDTVPQKRTTDTDLEEGRFSVLPTLKKLSRYTQRFPSSISTLYLFPLPLHVHSPIGVALTVTLQLSLERWPAAQLGIHCA